MLRSPNAVILSDNSRECDGFGELLNGHALLECVSSLQQLRHSLRTAGADVVFCSWQFYRDSWQQILDLVDSIQPDLPVIVLSSGADEQEWIEVLESGAFDLLAWPSPRACVLAAAEHAAESHNARKMHGLSGDFYAEHLAG